MRRPFIIMRIVLFVLVLYMNVLALGFAAWDIVAMKSAGAPSFGPPIFVIFNSCVFFFCLCLAYMEKLVPEARTAQVNFECGWTGVLSSMQLAAAVDIIVMGPPNSCLSSGSPNTCAASNVLAALTWVSALTLLLYFLALLVTAISHMERYPGIWRTSVNSVPWFEERDLRDLVLPTMARKERPRSFESRFFGDCDPESPPPKSSKSPTTPQSFRPTWAKSIKLRRGVDNPFTFPGARPLTRLFKSCWPGGSAPPPVPEKKKLTPFELPPLDIPKPARMHPDYQTPKPRGPSYSQFPVDIEDPDKPIAFRRFSEWIRADIEEGINVHTVPSLSPVTPV